MLRRAAGPRGNRRRARPRLTGGRACRDSRAQQQPFPAAWPCGAVRHRDRQLRNLVLCLPRPGREHHRRNRLVPDRDHGRVLGREPGRRPGWRGRLPGARPARAPAGHDRRFRTRDSGPGWHRRGPDAGVVRRGLAGRRCRDGRGVLPARVRCPDRLVRAGPRPGTDHADPGRGILQHHLRSAHRGPGRAAQLARRLPGPRGDPGPGHDPLPRPRPAAALAARPAPGARPQSPAIRCGLSWAAGRSCCW